LEKKERQALQKVKKRFKLFKQVKGKTETGQLNLLQKMVLQGQLYVGNIKEIRLISDDI